MSHRYGEFEQVNGATTNAALDRAEKLEQQRDKLLMASKLVLKSFAYAPGKGPGWYEAARKAVADAEAA